jgi:membrane protein YqaA with SNARE-associated domain
MFDFSAETGFVALFAASFVAAPILPCGSEVVLIGVIHQHPDLVWQAIGVATVGNTLGAVTSYWIGRLLPNRAQHRAIITLHRYGYWALLLSWLPLVGDALAVGAGWLRLNPWLTIVAFAVGKFLRYVAVGGGWAWFQSVFWT